MNCKHPNCKNDNSKYNPFFCDEHLSKHIEPSPSDVLKEVSKPDWEDEVIKLYVKGGSREEWLNLFSFHEASTRKAEREAVLEMIEGMKKKQKPNHGPCCYCQKCGYSYTDGDECMCSRNEILDSLTDKIKQRV